jgi:hypothetical protein
MQHYLCQLWHRLKQRWCWSCPVWDTADLVRNYTSRLQRCLIHRWIVFFFQYLCEFWTEFYRMSGYDFGDQMWSIHEKINQRLKISCCWDSTLAHHSMFAKPSNQWMVSSCHQAGEGAQQSRRGPRRIISTWDRCSFSTTWTGLRRGWRGLLYSLHLLTFRRAQVLPSFLCSG